MSQLISKASNITYTENGALTYASTENKLLDFFAMGGALRNADVSRIREMVLSSFKEDRENTIKVLLYLRDIRGGQGEKKIYREGMKALFENFEKDGWICEGMSEDKVKEEIQKLLEVLIDTTIEVGSFKDIVEIFEPETYAFYVKKHLNDKSSLMFKWLPSIGGGQNKKAERLASALGMKPKTYRKMLSAKRKELDLVETKLCNKDYSAVDYNKVPSQANIKYKDVFHKHDKERYLAFLEDVKKGKTGTKINASTLLPYQLVQRVIANGWSAGSSWNNKKFKDDDSLEVLWKNLPDFSTEEDAIVVADTSGSMEGVPMGVSIGLALYFAERNRGRFKDEFITFSEKPTFFHLDRNDTFVNRVSAAYNSDWGMNTNLQAVFDLILDVAVEEKLPQCELPKTVYIISDMEFDEATSQHSWGTGSSSKTSNYKAIAKKFKAAGYDVPNLIFWNVNSRQNNVPVRKNDQGVALVSGCSPSIFAMAVGTEDFNPLTFMNEAIDKERYNTLSKNIMERLNRVEDFTLYYNQVGYK